MSGYFKYPMKPGYNVIGKKLANYEPDVQINGVSIHWRQCVLDYSQEDRRTTLIPNDEDPKRFRVMINGSIVTQPALLNHGDRLLVGLHHYFLFVDPHKNINESCDYEYAMKEANKDQMSLSQQDDDADRRIEDKIAAIKSELFLAEQKIEKQERLLLSER